MSEWCGAEEETQVCSLVWCPWQVITRLNTYHGDGHHCSLQTVYTGMCLHLSVQAVSNYTGHGHGLSLDPHMFLLFLTEHSFPRGFLGHKDVGFSVALSHEEHFSVVGVVHFSSSLSWLIL